MQPESRESPFLRSWKDPEAGYLLAPAEMVNEKAAKGKAFVLMTRRIDTERAFRINVPSRSHGLFLLEPLARELQCTAVLGDCTDDLV